MQYYIGIDDTDNTESRGTGHLARYMADALAQDFDVHGVTRHQLLFDPRVPMTAKNSCAGILFSGESYSLAEIASYARKIMLADFQPGSDPGLCVANEVPEAVVAFGKRAQLQLVRKNQAAQIASQSNIHLEGLGGNNDGIIGALAAVGLLAYGSDGRYVQIGRIRELEGLQPIEAVLAAGVAHIQTLDGETITQGQIQTDKMRPSRFKCQPILFAEWGEDHWLPLKLD